jgi:hypothetical protein
MEELQEALKFTDNMYQNGLSELKENGFIQLPVLGGNKYGYRTHKFKIQTPPSIILDELIDQKLSSRAANQIDVLLALTEQDIKGKLKHKAEFILKGYSTLMSNIPSEVVQLVLLKLADSMTFRSLHSRGISDSFSDPAYLYQIT